MELFTAEVMAQVVAQLGLGAVFLFLYFKERDSHRLKDERINAMTDNLLVAYQRNATVIEKHNESIRDLARAIEETSRTMREVKSSINESKNSVDSLTQVVYTSRIPSQNVERKT